MTGWQGARTAARILATLAADLADAVTHGRVIDPGKPFDVHVAEALAVAAPACAVDWCQSPRDNDGPVCRTHRVIAGACLRVIAADGEDVAEWDREIRHWVREGRPM